MTMRIDGDDGVVGFGRYPIRRQGSAAGDWDPS